MKNAKPSHPFQADSKTKEYSALARKVESIRKSLIDLETISLIAISGVIPEQRESARNLLHYIALRRHDLRPLQSQLSQLGLSSFGRSESHVLASIDAVLAVLDRLCGVERAGLEADATPSFMSGPGLLCHHTEVLLGPGSLERQVRIMVTMPSEAASNYSLIRDLLAQGMDCMRINCAHDDKDAWQHMIQHLQQAEREVGRTCKVLMDLAGPKLRTGPVEPGPAVVRIRPKRDAYGRTIAPAKVWLFDETSNLVPPLTADASLPVCPNWLKRLSIGDSIQFVDAAGRSRHLEVIKINKHAVWAQSANSAFVVPGTILQHHPKIHKSSSRVHETKVGNTPRPEGYILLQCDDILLLTPTLQLGVPAKLDKTGRVRYPAKIGCTLPEIVQDARIGDAIWFDDGKIGGVVEQNDAAGLLVRILHATPGGVKLRGDKGINLPDSQLRLPALTEQDRTDLQFVVEHADLVAMSFTSSAQDVIDLIKEIDRIGKRHPGIILKIETRSGFENLPDILLEAMRSSAACGVMIARGDLAVECGYQRLAEVQEEILWICEAAHVPVIWATQVLENLAKNGIPSRAEISDAALGNRAECVMLNKGEHILQALETLNGILCRMQNHQNKKNSMMRKLKLAQSFHSHS
ncbi:MAG: pyruvate kinase [Candidatus Nitrotoga sp.]